MLQGSNGRQKNLTLSRFCQLPPNRWLVGRLPYNWGQAYVTALGTCYHYWHPAEAALIRQAATAVLQAYPASHRRRVWRQIRHGIYAHYQEKLFLAFAPVARLAAFLQDRLQLPGVPELAAAWRQGRGVLIVTGHYGAVEFLPAALRLQGLPVAIIVRPATAAYAQAVDQRAALLGVRVIIPTPGEVLKAALQALRQGLLLIMEGDEFGDWRPDPRRQLSFLGVQVAVDRTLAVLQQRSRAPVFGVLLARQPGPHYCLQLQDFSALAPAELAAQWLKWLEAAIRQDPGQWYQWAAWGRYRTSATALPANGRQQGLLKEAVGFAA